MGKYPKIIYPVNNVPQLQIGAAGYPIHEEVALHITCLEAELVAVKAENEAYKIIAESYSTKEAELAAAREAMIGIDDDYELACPSRLEFRGKIAEQLDLAYHNSNGGNNDE